MISALAGVRVLELSGNVAGPQASCLPTQYGADMVKIEPPDGDPGRAFGRFPPTSRTRSVPA